MKIALIDDALKYPHGRVSNYWLSIVFGSNNVDFYQIGLASGKSTTELLRQALVSISQKLYSIVVIPMSSTNSNKCVEKLISEIHQNGTFIFASSSNCFCRSGFPAEYNEVQSISTFNSPNKGEILMPDIPVVLVDQNLNQCFCLNGNSCACIRYSCTYFSLESHNMLKATFHQYSNFYSMIKMYLSNKMEIKNLPADISSLEINSPLFEWNEQKFITFIKYIIYQYFNNRILFIDFKTINNFNDLAVYLETAGGVL